MVKETNKNGLSFYFEFDWYDPDGMCVRTWGDGGIYDRKITYDEAQALHRRRRLARRPHALLGQRRGPGRSHARPDGHRDEVRVAPPAVPEDRRD